MTSKTSLTALIESVLTTHDYTDGNGVVSVNVADGLFAIASALNRLASAHETGLARSQEIAERMSGVIVLESDDEAGGHA